MRFLQNDERFGVDLADNGLQLRGLPPPDGAEQNLLLLAGITAAALQNRDAAVELFLDGLNNVLKAFGDDERDRGIVQPIDDPVHHDGRHIERHGGIEGLADIVIDCAGQGDDGQIDRQQNPPKRQRTEAPPEQARADIRAAGGRAAEEHQPQPHAGEDAAIERAEQNFRLRRRDACEHVHQQRAGQHTGQRAEEKLPPEPLAAQNEQRYVDEDAVKADAAPAGQLQEQHADTAHAADVDLVRQQEEIKAQREDRAAEDRHAKHPEPWPQLSLFQANTSDLRYHYIGNEL